MPFSDKTLALVSAAQTMKATRDDKAKKLADAKATLKSANDVYAAAQADAAKSAADLQASVKKVAEAIMGELA